MLSLRFLQSRRLKRANLYINRQVALNRGCKFLTCAVLVIEYKSPEFRFFNYSSSQTNSYTTILIRASFLHCIYFSLTFPSTSCPKELPPPLLVRKSKSGVAEPLARLPTARLPSRRRATQPSWQRCNALIDSKLRRLRSFKLSNPDFKC
jgi:hypothetical protein